MEGISGFCRACLIKFDDPNVLIQYTDKNRRQFFYLTGIQVKKNDQFIFQLCKDCYQNLILACKFKKLCRTSDKQFNQYLALKEAGGAGDFEEFLRTNESAFSYPTNNDYSTPIYKPSQESQDGDNGSTCGSFRSFMKDLMKADDLPDTAYKIIEEVIQEEADILDNSIDTQWLQDDEATDLNFDFSFSMFRSPNPIDSPQDNRFPLNENRTPDHQYIPNVEPYTPIKDFNTVTKQFENNTSAVNTEVGTNKKRQKDKVKEVKKIRKIRKPKTKAVKLDAATVKGTLKVGNNESFHDKSTNEKNPIISRVESEITLQQESDLEPNKYNLRKVKRKRSKYDEIEKKTGDGEGITKKRRKYSTAGRPRKDPTERKKFFKGRIVSQTINPNIQSDSINPNTQSDSFSLSEFNIGENDTILKSDHGNVNHTPLNQSLTKCSIPKVNINFTGQPIMTNTKQYQEIVNQNQISTNQYNKLENTPISYDNKSGKQKKKILNVSSCQPNIVTDKNNGQVTLKTEKKLKIENNVTNITKDIPLNKDLTEYSTPKYNILNIGLYQSQIVTDKTHDKGTVKTEQDYKIEEIDTKISIVNYQNNDLLNIGINQHETVPDIIDSNIEMALNQSDSDLIPLEDILNASGVPLEPAEPDQNTEKAKQPDIKQYFQSFIEEINTPLKTDGQPQKTGITILENIKIKASDDQSIIDRFINENKDKYNSNSSEKLKKESIVEMVKIFDLVTKRCDMCHKNFKNEHSILYHLSKRHKIQVKRKYKQNLKKNFICLVCGKAFNRQLRMEKHMGLHKAIVLTCDICKANFTRKSAIRMHIKSHLRAHKLGMSPRKTDDKPLKCDECGLRMKNKGNMITHKKRHNKVYKFECLVCHHRYLTKSDFDEHTSIHTGEKPFKCTICPKAYRRRDAYNTHIRMHDEKSLFDCPFCTKKFLRRSLLNQHLIRNKTCRERKLIMSKQNQNDMYNESQYKAINPARINQSGFRLSELEEIPAFDLGLPETDLGFADTELVQPGCEFDDLFTPETSIFNERLDEDPFMPINFVEDESLNLFPENNNLEKEYVINPSFF